MPITDYEKELINDCSRILARNKIKFPAYYRHQNKLSRWSKYDTLKLVYTAGKKEKEIVTSAKVIRDYISDRNMKPSKNALKLLKKGVFYLFGRDR